MSLIEEAARRLEQLRNAGIDLGSARTSPRRGPPAGAPTPPHEAVIRELESKLRGGELPVAPTEPEPPLSVPPRPAERSRTVKIDLARLAAAGMVTPDAPRTRIADEFRVIKRPLLGNAQHRSPGSDASPNLIMVTSALAGEGKSFTALNLAMSMAMELDNTVLLVDADVANPSLLQVLGLPPAKGLLDALTEQRFDLGRVILRTNVDKLALLPAGTPDPRATELLASDAMARLVREMANRYHDRVIVFDSPPLLLATEARVLASHMGQIIVVVEAERTTAWALKQALDTIERCPIVMTMLNKAKSSEIGPYYGYGYQYSPAGRDRGARDA
jgi:receptor protein-tyrosine kinase